MKIGMVEYMLLFILLVLYIIFGIHTPIMVSQLMDSGIGIIIIMVVVIYILYISDIWLTLVSIVAGALLIYRTSSNFISNIPGMTKSQQYEVYNTVPMEHLRYGTLTSA